LEAIVAYVIIWWLVFFLTLPIGVHREEAPDAGHDPGAPVRPRLGRKALITTLLTSLVVLGLYWLAETGRISLRWLAN